VASGKEDSELGAFIVHDDLWGPYKILLIDEWLDNAEDDDAIIVPVPPGLNLSGEDAETVGAEIAISTIRKMLEKASDVERPLLEETMRQCENSEIAVRTYASDSSDFKRSFCERSSDAQAKAYLSLSRMPKYVWVIELIVREDRVPDGNPVIGEVVVDATAKNPASSAALWFHIPGYLSVLDRLSGTTTDQPCGTDSYASGRWAQRALSWEFSSLGRRSKSCGADLM
jgi:hypothetical protein